MGGGSRLALLVCVIIYANVNSDPVIKKEYVFDALKCNDVRVSATYSGRKFCNKQVIKSEYGVGQRSFYNSAAIDYS